MAPPTPNSTWCRGRPSWWPASTSARPTRKRWEDVFTNERNTVFPMRPLKSTRALLLQQLCSGVLLKERAGGLNEYLHWVESRDVELKMCVIWESEQFKLKTHGWLKLANTLQHRHKHPLILGVLSYQSKTILVNHLQGSLLIFSCDLNELTLFMCTATKVVASYITYILLIYYIYYRV